MPNPLKVSRKLAKANYAAAKKRGDAAAARRWREECKRLKAIIGAAKSVPSAYGTERADVLRKQAKQADRRERKAVKRLQKAAVSPAPAKSPGASRAGRDAELEEIRWWAAHLDDPDQETRRGCLARLEKALSPDELADVLLTKRAPQRITRVPGPDPKATAGTERLEQAVRDLSDARTSPTDRAKIVDHLVKAAGDDQRAQAALAEILGKIR